MSKFFVFFLCFITCKANCQPTVTDASNKRIMEWDSSYQIDLKYFRANYDFENLYYCSVRKNQYLIAEYFRHDDTSYLFVSYDTSGKRLERGLIRYGNEIFDSATVQILDYASDPDGSKGLFKDTTLYENSYRKDGIWWEKDSSEMIWKGEYKNGLREGEWKEGIRLHVYSPEGYIIERQNDYFRPYIQHYFKKGTEIQKFKTFSFWPKIKGKWFATISALGLNTYLLSRQALGKIYFNFETYSSFSSVRSSSKPKMPLLEKYMATWKQNEDLIEITDGVETKKFQVLSIKDDELILRVIK